MNPMLIAQLVLMIGVFYFLIIMPKNKKIKLEKQFLTDLKTKMTTLEKKLPFVSFD